MTNLYFASPETRVFHERYGSGTYIDNIVAQLSKVQQPFLVINGSGNRHNETAQLIRLIDGELAYVHIDHHTDIGNSGKFEYSFGHTEDEVREIIVEDIVLSLTVGLNLSFTAGPFAKLVPDTNDYSCFVRDIAQLPNIAQIVILGEAQGKFKDMSSYREILSKLLMYSSRGGVITETYYNCDEEDIALFEENPSVKRIEVFKPPNSINLDYSDAPVTPADRLKRAREIILTYDPNKYIIKVERKDIRAFQRQMKETNGNLIKPSLVYVSSDFDAVESGILTDFNGKERPTSSYQFYSFLKRTTAPARLRTLNVGYLKLAEYLGLLQTLFRHKAVVSGDCVGISERFASGNGLPDGAFASTAESLDKVIGVFLRGMQELQQRDRKA